MREHNNRQVTKLLVHLIAITFLLVSNTLAQEGNNISSMSSSKSFFAKLESRIAEIDSHLCVGLDPHIKELFPNGDGDSKSEQERCDAAFSFCKRIIDATGKSYFHLKDCDYFLASRECHSPNT
jgi:hypothetical protein